MADARDDDEIAMEQEMELEALEAILMDDLCELSADEARDVGCEGDLRCFRITIHAVEDPEPDSFPPVLGMVFAHTPRYPDAPPFVKVDSISGLTDGDLAEVREAVTAQIEHGLGEAVIFDLVTCAKECMQARLADAGGGDGKGGSGGQGGKQGGGKDAKGKADKGKDAGGGAAKDSNGRFFRDRAGTQLCWEWNRKAGGCTTPCPSNRAHVCEVCRGPHRAVDHPGA